MRFLYLLYGLLAYLLFFVTILYAIGFVADQWVPKGIDDGPVGPVYRSIAIDILLLGLFAVQHNLMARQWFKDWWTRLVPQPIERATFVAASSLLLMLLFWKWQPLPSTIWQIDNAAGRAVLWAVYFIGWGLVFYSSFLIDHFELFGLKQVVQHFTGGQHVTTPFSERSLYRWVRHPLMLGFILAFWSAPTMSAGRLLFAGVTTAWILIAIQIEERDLIGFLGEPYARYRSRTPMLVPWRRPLDN